MPSTPKKMSTNPSIDWRPMTVLKTSTKANDSPHVLDDSFTSLFEYQPEIEAILDFRLPNGSGTEEYLVAWKCSDLKTTWMQEPVLESLFKDDLLKFWVKIALSTLSVSDTDSVKNIFIKKLRNWSSSPTKLPNSPKKEPPVLPPPSIMHATEKPYESLEGIEMKPPLYTFGENRSAGNDVKPGLCPNRLQGILEPQEYVDLMENEGYEIGEVLPRFYKNNKKEGLEVENDKTQNSFLVFWSYISYETPVTLGLNEDDLSKICFQTEDIVHIGRKKYEKALSVRRIPVTPFLKRSEEYGQLKTRKRIRCSSDSEQSDASTHPPSSESRFSQASTHPPLSSGSESGSSEGSTSPPSSSEPELMEYDTHGDFLVHKVAMSETACQTEEIIPFTCVSCHAKKQEPERLTSLRQRKPNKQDEDEKESVTGKMATNEGRKEDEEEDEEVPIEYEIEKILDYRMQEGTNADEYYIRWKNYTPDYDTWEPDSNLSCCDKALITFYVNRAAERRNAEQELAKHNGTIVPAGGGAVASITTSSGKKKVIKVPALPPIPEVVFNVLNNFIPISEGETEMAFKLAKTVKKKTIWTKKKLLKVMLDLIGDTNSGSTPSERASVHAELPVLRHQLLMIEAERKKDLVFRELKEWERQLNITAKGRPEIVVENNYDLAGPPVDFKYINDNVLGEGVQFPDFAREGCNCLDSCLKDKTQCCPGKHGKVLAYNSFKRLRVLPGYPIYECNKRCKCGPDCVNRVVQNGTVNLAGTKLCIFRTNNDRGWGVKTLKRIKKGTFVCLYAGEIITSEEAEQRGQVYEKELGASYLFDLDYYAGDNDDTCPYTIDATKMGNVAHFINHSCDPNLSVFNVWADCVDQNLPKLAFFALRDISRDEELTYDYGTSDDPANSSPPLPSFPSLELPEPQITEITDLKEVDEETGSDIIIGSEVLFSNSSPAKNRMKPATAAMSAARRPCLCGAKTCRKVLF